MPVGPIWDGTNQARVDDARGLRVNVGPRTINNYETTGISGVIAAALGAASAVYAHRIDLASPRRAIIERIALQYTTIVAYTTPITAARRLALFRGSGAAATGGVALVAVRESTAEGNPSECNAAQGGDIRIANTAALGVAGITFETDPIRTLGLTHVGAAGGFIEEIWEPIGGQVCILEPGELIAVRNPAAMDAAGTWQLVVNVEHHEYNLFAT